MAALIKNIFALTFFGLVTWNATAQKTLVVEKIGTGRRYCYHVGDMLKLRVSSDDTLLKGRLWAMTDSVITLSGLRPIDIRLADVSAVYKQFRFPKKLGGYLVIGGLGIFTIIAANHLLNDEQVFTTDMYIISGSMIGAGLASLLLSEKKCRIGSRWKIKVLNANIE